MKLHSMEAFSKPGWNVVAADVRRRIPLLSNASAFSRRRLRRGFETGSTFVQIVLGLLFVFTASAAEEPGRLEGSIGAAGGQSVSNAWVFVYSAAPREGPSVLCPTCYPDCVKRARTDAQGRFIIEPVDPNLMFRLLVLAKGYRPDFIKDVDPQFGGATLTLRPLKITNTPPENRVTAKLIDPEGKPVAGVRVNAEGIRNAQYSSYGATSGRVDPMAVSDENGEFFLDCTNGIEAITVLIEPRNLAKRRLWLDTGKAHLLRLKEGVAVVGRLLHDGKPLAGASVSMNTEDRSSEVFMRGFDVATDAEGRFKLPNIPANNRLVLYTKMKEMQEKGVALAPQKVSTGADGSTVDLGDLKVGPAYTLQGKVVTSDGQPLPARTRLYLNLEGAWDNQDTRPDDDGWFQFLGVPASPIGLSLRVTGYRISAKNPSKDWLNEGMIVGQISTNMENFIIHLERGERFDRSDGPPDNDRQPTGKPLRGATH